MSKLRKFLALPATDRALLVRAWCYLVAARVAVSALSFPSLQKLLTRSWTPSHTRVDAARAGWAVAVVAPYVPFASCLPQAVATHVMAARSGVATTLVLGVDQQSGAGFRAHAWVELNGAAIVGGRPEGEFTELARIH